LARASGTLFPSVRSRRAGREAGALASLHLTLLHFTSLEVWRGLDPSAACGNRYAHPIRSMLRSMSVVGIKGIHSRQDRASLKVTLCVESDSSDCTADWCRSLSSTRDYYLGWGAKATLLTGDLWAVLYGNSIQIVSWPDAVVPVTGR
jgi:hypothetical protein